MPAKKRIKRQDRQITTPPNADSQSTSTQCNRVQPTVHNGQRELDNREYDQGYGDGREEVLRNEKQGEDQRSIEGCSDPLEGALTSYSNFPKLPPPALFEANDLLDAATAFWGLEGDGNKALKGRSRKTDICWPRFVCCAALREKGMTLEAIGKVLGNRDHGTVLNAVRQFKNICETNSAYRDQAIAFAHFCWTINRSAKGTQPTKTPKLTFANDSEQTG